MSNVSREIKTLWIRQLIKDWENANYTYFNNLMTLPEINLFNSEVTLGKWDGSYKRTIGISSYLILSFPWEYTQEVLYHEMVHQYIEEILGITNASPHGEVFKEICDKHCIDKSASGDITSWVNKKKKFYKIHKANNVVNKIHKLFALAKSPNQHEAQLAMVKAHNLLTKYNISLMKSDINHKYIYKQIGSLGRKNPVKSMVNGILVKFFFVNSLWVFGYDQHVNKEGRILEIYGTAENVEMAEYVHDFLHNTSDILWNLYKKENNISGNKHRRTFIYGLLKGFYKKLEGETKTTKLYKTNSENRIGCKDLVYTENPKLNDYFRRRNPKIQSNRVTYTKSSSEAYLSGINKGKDLVIHKGIYDNRSNKNLFLSKHKGVD